MTKDRSLKSGQKRMELSGELRSRGQEAALGNLSTDAGVEFRASRVQLEE